jgi:hypothetical protein
MNPKTYSSIVELKFHPRQVFFWATDAKLFSLLSGLPNVPRDVYQDRVTGKEMGKEEYFLFAQKAIAEGRSLSVSHRLKNEPFNAASHTSLAAYDPKQANEYHTIIQSRNHAISQMLNSNEGQILNAKGKVLVGGNRVDEKVFVQRLIQKHQATTISFPSFPQTGNTIPPKANTNPKMQDLIKHVVLQATEQNDMEFLRKTFRKPPERKKLNQGLSDLQEFLVDFWCLQCNGIILERKDLPPLSFFTDEALTAYCAHALGKDPDKVGDVGKQRRRLNLLQAKHPRIKTVTPHPNGILLR